MSGRLRTVSRRVGLAAIAIAVVCGLGAWSLLSTEAGLRLAWRFAEGRLPETVQVERVSGRLRSPLKLTGIRYLSDGAEVEVASIDVVWDLLPLLGRALDVEELLIEQVRVTLPDTSESDQTEEAVDPPPVSFPVEVTIVRTTVKDIRLLASGSPSEPTVVDSVVVSDLTLASDIRIGALVAGGPIGRFEASGRVTPDARYPFELEASWDVPTPEWGPAIGQASAVGDLDLIEVGASLRQPLEATFDGTVLDPMVGRSVQGRIVVSETDFRRFAADAPEGSATLDIDIEGVVDSLDATGSAHVDGPMTGPVNLEASIGWRDGVVLVDRLRARLGATIIDVTGDVALLPEGPMSDLAVAWSDVRWPLLDEARVRSRSGTARIRGTPEAYRFEGDSRVSADAWPTARVRMRGSGTSAQLALEDVRVEASAGRLTGHGTVGWAPVIRWDMELSGRDLDTRAVLADTIPWQGVLSFDGRSHGSLVGDVLIADFTVDTLLGTLAEDALGASTSARLRTRLTEAEPDWATAELNLRWLEAEWGSNRAFVHGTVADTLRMAWTLAIPDLGVVSAGMDGELEGAVEGRGRVTGDRAFPELEGSITASGIVTETARIADATVGGVMETAPAGTVDIEARAEGIIYGERVLDTLDVVARGTPDAHDIRGTVTSAADRLELAASGGVAAGRWSGMVERLDVLAQQLGTWRLTSPVEASLSADSARIERGCWSSDPGEVCAAAGWQAGGSSSLTFAIDDLPGERLAGSLPAGWSLAVAIDADGSMGILEDGTLAADVRADFGSGRIVYPATGGPRTLTYSTATMDLGITDADGARSSFEAALVGEQGGAAVTLSGEVSLPDFVRITDTTRTQAVRGSIEAHVQDFGALDAIMPQLESIAGDLRVDVELSGSVDRPEFLGEAHLREGRADLPDLGLSLREIELTARGRGLEGVTIEGGMTSGTGRVRVTGEIPVAPSAALPATVRFTGTRFQAVDLPEAQIWVSPDVTVTAHPERIGLSGRVRVPRAQVELSEIPEASARPSRDVVFVGDTIATRPLPSLGLDVRVDLGDSVSFQGFGFSARSRGALVVTDGAGGATVATGEVTLENGRYRAYGQDLTMERGRILFAGGPVENPGLDIRASRTAQDGVVAGLQVAGTLRRPEVTLFSEPAMMESEVLAYIVLGRPLGSASVSEGSRVANAAASLGIREGNVLANRIGQRFGLAEVRVAADGPLEEASLVAGKYLSPALYVSYGVGLFEPISTFRLRYLLSGRWTLQAESGKSAGADLLYRIERGR